MKISSFSTACSFAISISIIALVVAASANAGTPLPEWAVDTPPAPRAINWSAGCFIPVDGGVVVAISQVEGAIQLPFGKAKDGDETPRETAVRETLEETGLTVETHEVVAVLASEPPLVVGDINQSILYLCTTDEIVNYEALDATEVSEALVLNPDTMLTPDGKEVMAPWRFQGDRELLIFLLQDRK